MTSPAGVGTLTPQDLPLLQQRSFRMLTFNRLAARIASNAINFALVLLIVEETGLAFMSSLLVLALIVPGTVIGVAAGVIADAFPKRTIIVLTNLARSAICAYIVFQGESVAIYFAIAITLASVMQFASAAEGALVPAIVGKDRLAKANAINQAVMGLSQIIGFVILVPIALRLFDSPQMLFAIGSLLFFLAAVYGLLIGRVPRVEKLELGGEPGGPWWAVGYREMRRNPLVLRATMELTLISAAVIILGGIIPIYIRDTLNLPIEVGALVLLPAAVGILIGLRLAGFLAHRVPHGVLSTAGFIGFVVLLLLIAFARPASEFMEGYAAFSWLMSVNIGSFDGAAVFVMMIIGPLGFSYALVAVAAQTVLNDQVPLHLQGRVLSTQSAFAALASSIPVLIAGAMTDLVGVTAVLATLSLLIGAAAVANLKGPRRQTPMAVGAR
jgi:MFS transporter, DHA3 family, macrolide efflux protein